MELPVAINEVFGGSGILQFALLSLLGGAWACIAAGCWFQRRARASLERESRLAAAVCIKTDELIRSRSRERARSAILEQLLTSQSLGTVLDSIAGFVGEEIPGCVCAVLLKRPARWHVAAAPGVKREWLNGLREPHVLPCESWLRDASWGEAETPGQWSPFLAGVAGAPPLAIHSRVIGNTESTLGVLVAFETGAETAETGHRNDALHSAAQLAFIAMEHWQYYDDLRHRAHHDSLTGLPNRMLFEERLTMAVQDAGAGGQAVGVISIDLDRFRKTNDLLGPGAGDIVLAEVGNRIRNLLRPGQSAARTGGDEFMLIAGGLIADGIQGPVEIARICANILEAVGRPMLVDGHAVTIAASLGSAVFPHDDRQPEGLRRKSEAALACAKRMGRNRAQAFAESSGALDCARLEEDIRTALDQNLFAVHYQPKVGADGDFRGLEALARLTTPERGVVPPVEFIPVAEEAGLISRLGGWVLSEVCRQMKEWHGLGLGWIPVAVNVSPSQIARAGFAGEVRACLQRFGVPPSALELELTESVVLGGGEESLRQMRELRGEGIRFSIDDFGTGYSSLSYLYLLPVDAIKLDRSFVQAIGTDHGALRLVQAMIGVAEGLGLNVIAEGVETDEQKSILIAAGCPVMQGYLFARPLPPAEVSDFLATLSQAAAPARARPGDASSTDDLLRLAEGVGQLCVQAV